MEAQAAEVAARKADMEARDRAREAVKRERQAVKAAENEQQRIRAEARLRVCWGRGSASSCCVQGIAT